MRGLTTSPRGGFTLLEMMVTISIFAGLLSLFTMSLSSSVSDRENQEHLQRTRADGHKAMAKVRDILSQTQIGAVFPQTFTGNTIGATHANLGHGAAVVTGPTPVPRELAYLVPVDADANGWPDHNGAGSIVWSTAPDAIACEPGRQGENRVRAIRSDGTATTLANGIRSIEIDDAASSGFAIPLNALRITVHLDREPGAQNLPPMTFQSTILLSRDELLP